MLKTGAIDGEGRPRYACDNEGCDARGVLPRDAPDTWPMHGYGEFCGRPWAMHEPPALMLGDKLARFLEAVGMTPERWAEWKARLGYQEEEGCTPCKRRQMWLNQFVWLNSATNLLTKTSPSLRLFGCMLAEILRRLP